MIFYFNLSSEAISVVCYRQDQSTFCTLWWLYQDVLPGCLFLLPLMHLQQCHLQSKSEPQHDKTNKMTVRPAKTQSSLPSLISLHCALNGYLGAQVSSCGQRKLWSEWADAQGDLSLRWAHTHSVGFVMSWLKLVISSPPILTGNLHGHPMLL